MEYMYVNVSGSFCNKIQGICKCFRLFVSYCAWNTWIEMSQDSSVIKYKAYVNASGYLCRILQAIDVCKCLRLICYKIQGICKCFRLFVTYSAWNTWMEMSHVRSVIKFKAYSTAHN